MSPAPMPSSSDDTKTSTMSRKSCSSRVRSQPATARSCVTWLTNTDRSVSGGMPANLLPAFDDRQGRDPCPAGGTQRPAGLDGEREIGETCIDTHAWRPSDMSDWTIDPDALRHVCPNLDLVAAQRIADGLGEAFMRFEINTPRRAAMAVAQWGHESDHFKTATEYASGDSYEGRKDLGNTQKGDGRRFKGRGRIQITGRANYEAIAKALDIDCVDNPDLLAAPPNSELASGFWWSSHGCN